METQAIHRKLNKAELDEQVIAVIELWRKSKPGVGPAEQRAESRRQANNLCMALPENWFKKCTPSLVDLFTAEVN